MLLRSEYITKRRREERRDQKDASRAARTDSFPPRFFRGQASCATAGKMVRRRSQRAQTISRANREELHEDCTINVRKSVCRFFLFSSARRRSRDDDIAVIPFCLRRTRCLIRQRVSLAVYFSIDSNCLYRHFTGFILLSKVLQKGQRERERDRIYCFLLLFYA